MKDFYRQHTYLQRGPDRRETRNYMNQPGRAFAASQSVVYVPGMPKARMLRPRRPGAKKANWEETKATRRRVRRLVKSEERSLRNAKPE